MQYRSQARHYENSNIINKTKAVVHLENKNDEVFWNPVFQHHFPKDTFYFVSHSKNQNGVETGGCDQCLKFRPHLSKNFLIAIDSDYRYVMNEPDINIQHFILQTYTYSFENHFCYASQLDEICKRVCNFDDVKHTYNNTIFDFEKFLKQYSTIIYDLFIWHLSLLKLGNTTFTKEDFQSTIDIKNKIYDVDTDCQNVLNNLQQEVANKIKQLNTLYPTHDLESEKNYFQSLNLNIENCYLYVRGHDLHNALIAIINEVAGRLLNIEKQKIISDHTAINALYTSKKKNIEQEMSEVFKTRVAFNIYSEIEKISIDCTYI